MDGKYWKLIRAGLFLLLTFCLLSGILKIMNYKDMGGGGGWQRFYKLEKSADVIFFGSSHAHCTIDHGLLWDEYGIAGYTLSAGDQKIDSTSYFVKEALRTHSPRVIAVEMLGMTDAELVNSSTDVYRNSLGMRWSSCFGKYIGYMADNMNMGREERQQVFFKLPVVHSRYGELTRSDFEDTIPFMMGYRGSYERVSFDRPEYSDPEAAGSLDPQRLSMLREILDTAKERGVYVVLFASPYVVPEETWMQFNALEEFARQEGVPFLNYNKLYDELSIDFEKDFRDTGHVNNYGAAKVTEHLARFLEDNYELPDRRGCAGYELWEDNALYLRNKELGHDLEEAQDINEYLAVVSAMEEEQLVLLALTGNYNAQGEVYLDRLMELGITREEYAAGGLFLFRGGQRVLYLPGREYSHCIDTDFGELHMESTVRIMEGEEKDQVYLLADGKDYAMVENGVNVIVYNEALGQLIDAAGVDVYLGLEMTHCEKREE